MSGTLMNYTAGQGGVSTQVTAIRVPTTPQTVISHHVPEHGLDLQKSKMKTKAFCLHRIYHEREGGRGEGEREKREREEGENMRMRAPDSHNPLHTIWRVTCATIVTQAHGTNETQAIDY